MLKILENIMVCWQIIILKVKIMRRVGNIQDLRAVRPENRLSLVKRFSMERIE